MMADGFGMLGDSEAMIAAYRECISCASFGKAPPMGQALVHCNLAVSLHKADEMDAASEHYSIASKLDPSTIEPRINLVASMNSAHHYQKGIALCRSLIPCVQKRDQLKVIYTNLGVALLNTDDFAGAADAHRMALSLDKRWALAHFNYAAALSALDDLDGAIREYSFVLRADPSDTEARGLVRELTARAAGAQTAARAHESRGIALVDNTNFSGAIRELEAAIREEPDRISSFRNLAKAYRKRADARKGYFGRKSLRSASTIGEAEPLSVDPQAVEADRDAAMSMLFEAHKIDSHDANVIFDIAKVQMCGYSDSADESTFNPSNAAEMLTKCVAENPEHPQAWQFLAQHYEACGDEDNAILACRNAVRANPRDSDSYYLLSNSLMKRSSGIMHGERGEVTREAMGTSLAAFIKAEEVARQYPVANRMCQILNAPGAAARLAAAKSAPPILWRHAMAQFEHVGVSIGAEGGHDEMPPKPKQRHNTRNKRNKNNKKKT
jgi:tetratricopeptide (TPR) repeat protein